VNPEWYTCQQDFHGIFLLISLKKIKSKSFYPAIRVDAKRGGQQASPSMATAGKRFRGIPKSVSIETRQWRQDLIAISCVFSDLPDLSHLRLVSVRWISMALHLFFNGPY
jgi:hypothetical protein